MGTLTVIPNDFEPDRITAGDSVTWRRRDLAGDYPSSAWSLAYYFRGLAGSFDVQAAADPTSPAFVVDVDAATSSGYAAGEYAWTARVSNPDTGEAYTIARGSCTVDPDPAAQVGPVDTRTWEERVLAAIEATIEGTASTDVMRWKIATAGGANREIDKMTRTELRNEWSRYKRLVEAQRRRADRENGKGGADFVLMRF